MNAGRGVKGLVAAVAIASALVVGGCGQADTAATVDGVRISEEDALLATTQINEAFSESLTEPLTTQQVLSQLIAAPFVNDAATQAGVGTTDSAARSAMPNLPDPSSSTLQLVRANFSLQQLDQQTQTAVLQQVSEANVSVNPRYGTFDAATVGFVASSPDWIRATEPADGATTPAPPPAPGN